jgi:hypothetical protein
MSSANAIGNAIVGRLKSERAGQVPPTLRRSADAASLRPYAARQRVEFVPDANESGVERVDSSRWIKPKLKIQNPEPRTRNSKLNLAGGRGRQFTNAVAKPAFRDTTLGTP